MAKDTANSSAKQDRCPRIFEIRVQQADPAAETIETIEITRHLERLLTSAPSATEREFFGLEYLAPVRQVFPCQQCGEAVARISVHGELRTVDAVLDADSEPFCRHWHANVIGREHECGGDE